MNITITISDIGEMSETNKEQLKEVLSAAIQTDERPDYYSVERMAIEHRMMSATSAYKFSNRFPEAIKPTGTIIDCLV
ncbi:MAG: hypothetical protein E7K14_01710 [Bacillota bacterium]|nr:hypothetical protein [Bacillota bacterium]